MIYVISFIFGFFFDYIIFAAVKFRAGYFKNFGEKNSDVDAVLYRDNLILRIFVSSFMGAIFLVSVLPVNGASYIFDFIALISCAGVVLFNCYKILMARPIVKDLAQ